MQGQIIGTEDQEFAKCFIQPVKGRLKIDVMPERPHANKCLKYEENQKDVLGSI